MLFPQLNSYKQFSLFSPSLSEYEREQTFQQYANQLLYYNRRTSEASSEQFEKFCKL